jgi:hypothetical protein
MGVPMQAEGIFLFNIDMKEHKKRGCFACGKEGQLLGLLPKQGHTQEEE